jgi:hypothetical protein
VVDKVKDVDLDAFQAGHATSKLTLDILAKGSEMNSFQK